MLHLLYYLTFQTLHQRALLQSQSRRPLIPTVNSIPVNAATVSSAINSHVRKQSQQETKNIGSTDTHVVDSQVGFSFNRRCTGSEYCHSQTQAGRDKLSDCTTHLNICKSLRSRLFLPDQSIKLFILLWAREWGRKILQ